MAQDNNNNNINTGNNSDDLYKVSAEDKHAGLRAIEPLPRSLNLVIVRFDNGPIKVDLSEKEWAAKLKTEAKDCGVNEEALSAAKKRLHLIEAEKLLEVAHQNELQTSKDDADRAASQSYSSATSPLAIDNSSLSLGPIKKTNSEKLVELITDMQHTLFVDQYVHPFILTKGGGGGKHNGDVSEAIELLDQDFIEYASGLYWDRYNEVLNGQDIKNAANVLAFMAKKRFVDENTGEPLVRPLYVRIAWEDPFKRDTIYLDLADIKRHIVVVKKGEGFRVISQNDAEIMFRRQNRLPLPIPTKPYDEDIAEQFLDLYQIPKNAHAKRLIAKTMMGIRMIPGIPHPIELPHGGKGGLKSSWCEAQKRMIDPATAMTIRIPENEDDFSLQGYHNYMLVYDNIKRKNVPRWFPDALCRWVYQEASEKRQHYSNMKTVAFGSSGCAIVNGINKMFEEEDVLDRCVMSEWRRLKPGQFKTRAKVEEEFQKIQPQLLACLCDKTAQALALYKDVEEELSSHLTRMADFMVWGECFARTFGYKKMEFVKAYKSNIELQNVEIVQNSTIGKVVVNFAHREYNRIVKERREFGTVVEVKYNKAVGPRAIIVFEGSIDAFYKKLIEIAQLEPFNIDIQKAKDWPKGTNKLSQWLRLILSNLSEAFGIDIEMLADTTGTLTGHRNRIWVQVAKNPDVAPADMFGSEDKPSSGDGDKRGKAKDIPSDSSEEAGVTTGSCKKVSTNVSLPSLRRLPNQAQRTPTSMLNETENHDNQSTVSTENFSETASFSEESPNWGSKDCKDSKDTFSKTFADSESATGGLHLATYRTSQIVLQELPYGMDKPSPLPMVLPEFKGYVSFDPEWDPRTDEWYEAAFTDNQRNRIVLHISDFGSEKRLIEAIVDKLNSYRGGVAFGWWSRGKLKFGKHYCENKKRKKRGDLIRLHEKCLQYGIESPVLLQSQYDSWPVLDGMATIDLHSVFDLPLVRDTIFHRKYQSTKLDEVYTALYPEDPLGGKLEGINSGDEVAITFSDNILVQRAYVQRDADMTLSLAEVTGGQLLGAFSEIAKEINLPFEEVCHSSLTKWWKRIFDLMGYTEPSKDPTTGQPYFWKAHKPNEKAYSGGLNLGLKEGLYYMLKVLDVASLYPFMAMLHNISFDRICCDCCRDDPVARVPQEVLVDADGNPLPGRNYWICQKQGDGAFSAKLRELWKRRAEYKAQMKKAREEGNEELAKTYEVKQLAFKILMNGGYGVFGNEYFHYRDMRVAELITAFGRYTLTQIESLAVNKYGFEITSGDTDSIFLLNNKSGGDDDSLVKQFIAECSERFKSRKENDELKFTLEDDRTYIKIILAASKNYVGLTTKSPKQDIKGMVGNKRSMPVWGREVFNGVVQDFFGKPDVIEDPRSKIRQAIKQLEAGLVPLYKLKKWERLDKDPIDYKNDKDPKKVYGQLEDLEEDDKIWYYPADKKMTEGGVSFTKNPAEINLQKYKEYLKTAVEPFLKALGDSEDDIKTMLGLPLNRKKKQLQQHQETEEGSEEPDN